MKRVVALGLHLADKRVDLPELSRLLYSCATAVYDAVQKSSGAQCHCLHPESRITSGSPISITRRMIICDLLESGVSRLYEVTTSEVGALLMHT